VKQNGTLLKVAYSIGPQIKPGHTSNKIINNTLLITTDTVLGDIAAHQLTNIYIRT